jgi:GH35 family endo-1,4-beta-xylanase
MLSIMRRAPAYLACLLAWSGALHGAALTQSEINQIENELGITLTAGEKSQLGAIAKPDEPLPQWRVDAQARIEAHRMADLQVEVVDLAGNPVPGAEVQVTQRDNAFRFGGVLSVRDMYNMNNVLANNGNSTEAYQALFLKLFNAAGLDNGFKPKQRASNEFLLPGFLEWAQGNDLPVRGHLLIWPGVSDESNHLPADILADVQAVEAAIAGGESQATIDALKATLKTNIDAMIAEWASLWPVYEWDVINETLSNTRVQELIGYDQMAEWFKIAEANKVLPDANLLINEFQIISANSQNTGSQGYANRSTRYKGRINRVLLDGGPLTTIGFQSRFKFEHPDPALIYSRLEDFGSTYGLGMVATEFEIRDTTSGPYAIDFSEYDRARITEEMLTTYYSHPLVEGFFAWTYMKDVEWSLCYLDGSLKLNALVWYYLHRIRYTTKSIQVSDTSGEVSVRGYKGLYDVTVSVGGQSYDEAVYLDGDQALRVTVDTSGSGDMWGMFPVINNIYADTGPWLGWLQVAGSPWVWSLISGDWVYVPDVSANAGEGWVYFF